MLALEQQGRLGDIIAHEMGHVLGFGTIWNAKGLLGGTFSGDPFFSGARARAHFDVLKPGYVGNRVPVENTGGAGTINSHWRETVFNNEMMTGFASPVGAVSPISLVTIASLADLGYSVNYSTAEPFPRPPTAAAGAQPGSRLEFINDIIHLPFIPQVSPLVRPPTRPPSRD
jgi:hypothetical protein